MGVAYLFYYECGFGFSSVKEVVDDIWEMGPRYDHIEEELLNLIKDPRPLLDGKEAQWRSATRTGAYPHMFGTDVQRPKPVIALGIREYLSSTTNEEYLLAAGLMVVCLKECLKVFRRFSETQLSSQNGTLRKEVVPAHERAQLPKIPISNSECESLLGRFKQEGRKKYNQKPRTTEVQVQSRSLGFYNEGDTPSLQPEVLRYAMQETRRRQPEERRSVVMKKHTAQVFEAMQEQIETLQRRQRNRVETEERYATLSTCKTIEDVDILLRGPSEFSQEPQPLARVKAQLNRWKRIEKVKEVHFSRDGKSLSKAELVAQLRQVVLAAASTGGAAATAAAGGASAATAAGGATAAAAGGATAATGGVTALRQPGNNATAARGAAAAARGNGGSREAAAATLAVAAGRQ
ncbi:hypothetical protein CYMTET_55663 [Cymbomonas tetramitiformis]|uniref:Uncharacterized protein n=1 Tax=Cymbomonas tetramitiformis TaxID=36881 RepID=A0AAE0BED2_9CHLO|nr:hypothetical protein CYMTET_55663 [Cymbomonas tetramitiformis]